MALPFIYIKITLSQGEVGTVVVAKFIYLVHTQFDTNIFPLINIALNRLDTSFLLGDGV